MRSCRAVHRPSSFRGRSSQHQLDIMVNCLGVPTREDAAAMHCSVRTYNFAETNYPPAGPFPKIAEMRDERMPAKAVELLNDVLGCIFEETKNRHEQKKTEWRPTYFVHKMNKKMEVNSAVSVWVKRNNGTDSYRVSDEDLTDRGYTRSSKDRDNFVVLLARSPGSCAGGCSIKIATNQRENGQINHQENVLGAPLGYQDLHDDLYCGRTLGACGADVPIFKYQRGNGAEEEFAYSMDPTAKFEGMTKDAGFACYGWADGGSVVHPAATEQNCMKLLDIANGRVQYSERGSGAFPLGTTAHTTCDSGYSATGQTQVLCTKKGWFPATLGGCVDQKARTTPQLITGPGDEDELGGDPSYCSRVDGVSHGSLVYSQPGPRPNGTRVTLFCDLGYVTVGESASICTSGEWLPEIGVCASALDIHCQPILTPLNGRVLYTPTNQSATPLTEGAAATLKCDPGFIVRGQQRANCRMRSWDQMLGSCERPETTVTPSTTTTTTTEQSVVVAKRQSSCSQLPVENGFLSISTLGNQQMATLGCNLGYLPNGTVTTLCQEGNWKPAIGKCISTAALFTTVALRTNSSCPDMQIMGEAGGASVNYSTSASGQHPSTSTATLKCPDGTSGQGTFTSTCTNGLWVPPALGTCVSSSLIPSTSPSSAAVSASSTSCSNPIILNGNLSYSTPNLDGTKPVGSQVYLTCPAGSSIVGASQAICQNGLWTPSLGACQPSVTLAPTTQACPGVLPPFLGSVNYSQNAPFGPFTNGTTVTLTCASGHIDGNSSSTCLSGVWSPPLGSCSLFAPSTGTQCLAMVTSGGTINYSASGPFGPFNTGTTGTLTCTTGTVQGNAISTCSNGVWTPTIGFCSTTGTSGTTCTFAPLIPLGATATYSTGSATGPFANGATVTVTCPSGQTMSGSAISTCSNGQWTTLGTCQTGTGTSTVASGGECLFGPTIPLNGQVGYSLTGPPYPQGTVATLTCSSGTTVNGQSTTTCQAGAFTPVMGYLSLIVGRAEPPGNCLAMASPPNAKIKYIQQKSGAYENGTLAELECDAEYTAAGDRLATCQNGKWVPERMGVCLKRNDSSNEQKCSPLASVKNGQISYSTSNNPYESGTRATVKCDEQFAAKGTTVSTCILGKWSSPTLDGCEPIQADPPGQRSPPTRSVNMPGAKCTAIPLKAYSSIIYSEFGFGPYSDGSSATISCHAGNVLEGEPSSHCDSGEWAPALGVCVPPVRSVARSYGLPIAHDQEPLAPKHYEKDEHRCTPPYSPAFGEITFSYPSTHGDFPVGTIAALRCNIGHLVRGPTFARCSSGSFRPVLGRCDPDLAVKLVGKCAPIPAPPHSKVTYIQASRASDYETGTTALLYCDLGYLVAGQPTLTCSSDGWEPATGFGTCQRPHA
ncbi:unnamed protein product, partial [Mesorhabditis spiculigera]